MLLFSDLVTKNYTATGSRRTVCVDVQPPDERRGGGDVREAAVGIILVGGVVVGGQLTSADAQELASAPIDFHPIFKENSHQVQNLKIISFVIEISSNVMNPLQEEVRGRRQVREGGGFNCGESEGEGKAEEEDGRRDSEGFFC